MSGGVFVLADNQFLEGITLFVEFPDIFPPIMDFLDRSRGGPERQADRR